MKSEYFLFLPVAATLVNVAFVFLVQQSGRKNVSAQPVVANVITDSRRGGQNCFDGNCLLDLNEIAEDVAAVKADLEDDEEEPEPKCEDSEDDPMLKTIPGTNFKAYVRADIATFYQKEPRSMQEKEPSYTGQAGKFVNISPERLSLYWVGGRSEPVFIGHIAPWAAGGTSTFPTHKFVFARPGRPHEVVATCPVVKGTSVYYYDPYSKDDGTDVARCKMNENLAVRSLDSLSDQDRQKYEDHKYNFVFAELYKNFTGGSEWLTMYPRNPPRHKIWPADYFGQEHVVTTTETHFRSIPEGLPNSKRLSVQQQRDHQGAYAEYRDPGTLNLTLKAASCAPRAFEVHGFLSDAEVDHLLALVERSELERSTTNGHLSETRTSSTTWLPRNSDPVLDIVFRRAAAILRMDESWLRDRMDDEAPDMPTKKRINEDLQIVHYGQGQQYTAHHDFGYPTGLPDSPSRSINVCLYLNNVDDGGETSFMRWRNAHTSDAISVKPEKGKAMVFFMVNPDGNLDDLSQHAAQPVGKGEKYFANLWIHDPMRA